MEIIILEKKTKVEKKIEEINKEMKTALPFSRQFLEGQLYILKELQQTGVELV